MLMGRIIRHRMVRPASRDGIVTSRESTGRSGKTCSASMPLNMPRIAGRLSSESVMGGKLSASARSSGSTRWRVEMGNSSRVRGRADLFGASVHRLPFRAIGTTQRAQPSLPPCSNACESGTRAGETRRKTVPYQSSQMVRYTMPARLTGAAR